MARRLTPAGEPDRARKTSHTQGRLRYPEHLVSSTLRRRSQQAWDTTQATRLSTRRQYQCHDCRHQTSVTAGTALHKTKLPLRVWFWAIFLVARHKKSISALQLMADLGLGSYRTAWLLLHKIRACFDESRDYPLLGLVEVDEAYVGGSEKGVMPGRAASKKGIVITGVEVLPSGRLGSARMKVIPDEG